MNFYKIKPFFQIILISIVVLLVNFSKAGIWISTDGTSLGNGSQSNPYNTFDTALSKHGGGRTYIFTPGTYLLGQLTLRAEHKGTPQNPTILKSYEKYGAVLNGSSGHGVYVHPECDWVIIDGFYIRGAAMDGLKTNADFTVFRNCWISNSTGMGISGHGANNLVIEKNVVEFNGRHIQFNHGIYVSGDNIIIRQNVIRYNAARAISLWGRSGMNATNTVVENNLIYGNTRQGLLFFGPEDKYNIENSGNKIISNTIVNNGYGVNVMSFRRGIISNNIILNNNRWEYTEDHGLTVTHSGLKEDTQKLKDYLSDITVTNNLLDKDFEDYNCMPLKKNNFIAKQSVLQCFIEPRRGAFYLRRNSEAISNADPNYLPDTDFFGTDRKTISGDIGCFSYYESLDDVDLYGADHPDWYYGWAFIRMHEKELIVPDLWEKPEEKPKSKNNEPNDLEQQDNEEIFDDIIDQ